MYVRVYMCMYVCTYVRIVLGRDKNLKMIMERVDRYVCRFVFIYTFVYIYRYTLYMCMHVYMYSYAYPHPPAFLTARALCPRS